MNYKREKQKGITLIALVITIIVLLILVGTSIATLTGKNGLLEKTGEAVDNYDIASEREYLELNILSVQMNESNENVDSEKLGEPLNPRDLKHSSNWHIIKIDNESYETGWNYIEKGTDLKGYRKAEYNWIINYETGEIIQLEEDQYLSLSVGDMLAVKDSIIINVDSSIIDNNLGNDKGALEKQLGDGVTLENFNYDNNSGLTSTSFKFDGINDDIKISSSGTQKEKVLNEGFTFEYYGSLEKGNGYNEGNLLSGWWKETYDNYNGIFCYWNGNKDTQATMRFGIFGDGKTIKWNAGIPTAGDPREKALSDLSSTEEGSGRRFTWNQDYGCPINLNDGQRHYFTVTLDTSEVWKTENGQDYYKNTIYLDGEKLIDAKYNVQSWEVFKDKVKEQNPKYLIIGASTFHFADSWRYSKMDANALRLYSRGLSEKEVMANYKKTVEYHSLIEK